MTQEATGEGTSRFVASASLVALVVPLAVSLALARASGGYFLLDWGVAGLVMCGAVAAAAMSLDVSLAGRLGIVAVSAFAGLAAWQGLSSLWAAQPSAAIGTMNLTLLYAAAFVLVLIGVRRRRDVTLLVWGSLAVAAVVVTMALGARLTPDLVAGDYIIRLSHPISYWNGLGLVAALGAAIAIGLSGRAQSRALARGLAAATVPGFLMCLLLTYSRGAALVLILGLLLLVAIAPARLETVLGAIASVSVTIPLLVATNGEDALAGIAGTLPEHASEGRRFLGLLVLTMLSAGLAGACTAALAGRLSRRARRLTGITITAAAVIGSGTALVAHMPEETPIEWSRQQIDDFKTFDTTARDDASSVSDRLAAASGTGRWQSWSVAAAMFADDPIAGAGAGSYRFHWERDRDIPLTLKNAHSLPLEVLGESGAIGLVLLLLPVAAVVIAYAGVRRKEPSSALASDLTIALVACTVVFLHLAGDWAWQLPGAALPAVVLAAGILKGAYVARAEPVAAAGLVRRTAIILGAAGAVALVVGPLGSTITLDSARASARAGNYSEALTEARSAQELNPQDPEARLLEANILTDLGRPAAADRAFAAAHHLSPSDWVIMADWGSALLRRGDRRAARIALRRATIVNPLEDRPRLLLSETIP